MADIPKRRMPTLRSTTKRGLEADGSDKDFVASKRPALSATFSNHITESTLNRQLLTAQSKVTELQNQLNESKAEVDRLKADRRLLAKKEEDERVQREEEASAHEIEKQALVEELTKLRRRVNELEGNKDELQDAYDGLSQDSQTEIAELKSELTAQTNIVADLESRLEESEALASTQHDTIVKLEARLEEAQAQLSDTSRIADNPTVSGSGDTTENWKVIREELHRQSGYMSTLEAANVRLTSEIGRLRQQAETVEVLKEEKKTLQRKVELVEDFRKQIAELENQLSEERAKRLDSLQVSTTETPGKTPITITRQLSALRTAHALLLDDNGQLKALLAQREAELSSMTEEQDQRIAEVERLKAAIKQANESKFRLERDYNLLEREVGFQKALVASYQAEEASHEGIDDTQTRTGVNSELELHTAHLEQLLEEYKATNKALENDIENLNRERGMTSGRSQQQWEALLKQAEESKSERDQLADALNKAEAIAQKDADRIEELEQTLFELRGDIATGEHVPPGVRVLSFKQNPAQEWFDTRKEILQRLKAENGALLKRLKDLEDSGIRSGGNIEEGQREGTDGAFVPRASYEALDEEKRELQDVIAQKEKRLSRLTEVFTKKSAEFREAIASIMGLKLAFYPNGQVRVTSQFDLRTTFVFQPAKKGSGGLSEEGEGEGAKMQLVAQGEGGLEDLPQLMRYWVEEEQCIPGFLASVTLECYDFAKRQRQMERE